MKKDTRIRTGNAAWWLIVLAAAVLLSVLTCIAKPMDLPGRRRFLLGISLAGVLYLILYKLIMICTGHERTSSIPVGNFMKILNFNDVYLTTYESIEKTDVFGECLDNEEYVPISINYRDSFREYVDSMHPAQ